MKYYKVRVDNLVFYTKVEYHSEDKRTVIQFGSAKFKDCLSIHVWSRRKVAELHGLIYNRMCSINMPLPKGDGTVRMVKAALLFAIQQFPHIRTFELTDVSQIPCGKKKMKISLSDFYFVTRGVSWYEGKFGAVLASTKYDMLKEEFRQKPHLDFDDLWEQYLQDGRSLYKHDKRHYAKMYRESPSWFAFLQEWFHQEGCVPFVWLSDVPVGIIAVVSEHIESLYGKVWEIPRFVVETYGEIDVKPASVSSFPDIEWRDSPDPKPKKGGQMLLSEEEMYH